ncbi:MAG: RelA/SpoT domain-containing protein [Candidatus Peregrinibacteria bacterium]|nr:RelA/SpoT domain-containing protein [Candidatus Peregrinibacteria bacterium]
MQSIKKDYKEIRKELNLIARYIEEKLHTLDTVHSVRYRIKDPDHLLAKIIRKKIKDPNREITIHNYKSSITDLIGIRAIHLFKEDWVSIHKFIEDNWDLHEQPVAYIREGDAGLCVEEYEKYKCNIELHPHGYRSVHYLIQSRPGRNPYIAEIQVRTIFEEGWSEIDHTIKYPNNIVDPLLNKFLDTFNVLAGNSDQMGSFVRRLKDDLLKGTEKIEEYEKLTEKNTEIINDLRKRIAGTIGELNSKIRNVALKINAVASSGIATEAFKNILSAVRVMASKFELMMATRPQEAASFLESAEQKLERVEKLLEMTLEENNSSNNTDAAGGEAVAGSYKKDVASFMHNLKTIAELEGGVAQKMLMDVQGQDGFQTKIENAVNEIRGRSGFVKFLIGPKYKSIQSLQAEIVANQERMKILTDAANLITDPAVQFVLQKQIDLFARQNSHLKAFVAKRERGINLFGWLVQLFH